MVRYKKREEKVNIHYYKQDEVLFIITVIGIEILSSAIEGIYPYKLCILIHETDCMRFEIFIR